jgi:hypothetical protein
MRGFATRWTHSTSQVLEFAAWCMWLSSARVREMIAPHDFADKDLRASAVAFKASLSEGTSDDDQRKAAEMVERILSAMHVCQPPPEGEPGRMIAERVAATVFGNTQEWRLRVESFVKAANVYRDRAKQNRGPRPYVAPKPMGEEQKP